MTSFSLGEVCSFTLEFWIHFDLKIKFSTATVSDLRPIKIQKATRKRKYIESSLESRSERDLLTSTEAKPVFSVSSRF